MDSYNSTLTSIDPPSEIERTIDAILDGLDALTRTEVDEDAFHRQVLLQTRVAIDANHVAIWSTGPLGKLHLLQHDGSETVFARNESHFLEQERKRLGQTNGNAALIVQTAGDRNHVAISCHFGERKKGVIAFYLDDSVPIASHSGFLEFANAVAEILTEYETAVDRRNHNQLVSDWKRYEYMTVALHRDWCLKEVAFQLANEGRAFLDCDRFSVAIRHGKNFRLVAVSGVDLVDRRSNLAKSLERLTFSIACTGETFLLEQRTDIEPQIKSRLDDYLECSPTKNLIVVPLTLPNASQTEQPFAALVIEQFQGANRIDLVSKTTAITKHASLSLGRAFQLRRIPLMQTALRLKSAWSIFERRFIPRWLLGACVLLGFIAALVFVKIDFEVTARGYLRPVDQKKIFATANGVVQDVLVSDGQQVQKGQPIVQLDSKELQLEFERVSGEMATAQKQLSAINAERLTTHSINRSTEQRSHQLSADVLSLKENISNLKQQLDIILQQRNDLTLRSPLTGTVVTWDVHHELAGRPVQQGQSLLEVSHIDGPWMIRLEVPDHRMGPILDWKQKKSEPLKVDFKLANEPEATYRAKVSEMAMATQSRDGKTAFVLVEASFDKSSVPQLRPGATVVGKIGCGQRSIAYVWTHEFVEELRRRFF